ncbi:MAG TPA: ABC transporter ATP-binding protein [Lachnospiraceae bacterium]|nr:ATP-binding cassette domain-containing protein [uncultured Lachnoclostridium sp.]HAU87156.1 ABC transporter ATP-binding protein [Lachnospiraceae bacterium]
MENYIEIRDLTTVIDGKTILDNVNLTVKKKTIYGFLGPNGAGKTTLMKNILTILPYQSGSIKIFGKELKKYREEILADIGSIIEVPIFYENCTAKEILKIHCEYMDIECEGLIQETLDMVGLENNENLKAKDFSLGMRQRLGLARALISKPKLLILDEPINGLDPMGVRQIRKLLMRMVEENDMSILISSHILSEIEHMTDTIGVLKKGRMLEEVEIEKLKKHNIDLESYFMAHFDDAN